VNLKNQEDELNFFQNEPMEGIDQYASLHSFTKPS
jgi:hypothetical protein